MKKKKLVILGGGTAGNIFSHRLSKQIATNDWDIILIDKSIVHYYQPGFLFIPFGVYNPEDVVKNKDEVLNRNVQTIYSDIQSILPTENNVLLSNGEKIEYDYLIIATGVNIAPEEVEGMKGDLWGTDVFDFYTYDGAVGLSQALKKFNKGNLVVHITEMPIKCPVAPLEFAFLSDWFFRKNGLRKDVIIHFVTPLPEAFTKPDAARVFSDFLSQKGIALHTDFNIAAVDNQKKEIVSWDNRTIPFDTLVTVPTNMGAEAIGNSGIGDELNLVPTNPQTLLARDFENIFVAGDASDIPTSKAGSVIHFQTDVIEKNLIAKINGRPMNAVFDGHANCFIETGDEKAILIDFDYNRDPAEGRYPIHGLGPLSLLKETRLNHFGKMAFKWLYWNRIIKGKEIPFT